MVSLTNCFNGLNFNSTVQHYDLLTNNNNIIFYNAVFSYKKFISLFYL